MAIAIGDNQINKAYLGTTQIQKMYLGSELVFDNGTVSLTPIMTNFRVEDANKDRVYFDVVGDISGMATTDFVVSGKTITGVDTVNNYFSVSVAFTFWDNNTIRLGENSDTFDGVQVNPTLDNFTLSYIINYIEEPTASTPMYVAVGGTGDGTSEGNAASLSTMETDAVAGQTWWIKAGNYGTETIEFTKSGTVDDPIKYMGYNTIIGDITSNYIDSYDDILNNWSDSVWPTLVGTDSGTSMSLGADFIIIRNIQSRNHQVTMSSTSSPSNVLIERLNHKDNSVDNPAWTGVNLLSSNSHRIRIKESVSLNMRISGFLIQSSGGSHHLFENVKSYSSGMDQDYYLSMSGSNSIIRNCEIYDPAEKTSNHGIGIKATGALVDNNWNLIEKNISTNIAESYYVRNNRTYYNVFKDNYAYGTEGTGDNRSSGFYFWGGARYNIVERNEFIGLRARGIVLQDNDESPSHDEIGAYNIVRNNIFDGMAKAVLWSTSPTASLFNDNYFYNNTFINSPQLYDINVDNPNAVIQNLHWKNNIFKDILSATDGTPGMTFDYNDFDNSWTTGIGANDINIDPQLDVNYLPANESLTVPKLAQANYDYNSKERADTTTIGGVTLLSENAGDTNYDYYVSESGDDSNPGTELLPWKTLSKVSGETFASGDIIGFNGGDKFDGSLVLDGLSNVTFTSYGSGKAEFKNDVPVTGWTSEGINIWSIASTNKITQVFKDGTYLNIGRSDWSTVTTAISDSTFIDTTLIGHPDLVGAYVSIKANLYYLNTMRVIAFDSGTGQVTMEDDTKYPITESSVYFLTNDLSLVVANDDWSWSDDKLYLMSASEPTGITVTNTELDNINIVNSSAITFNNLSIGNTTGFGIIEDGTVTNLTIDNCYFNYTIHSFVKVWITSEIAIKDCTINNSIGIYSRANDLSIIDCIFTDIGLEGNITNVKDLPDTGQNSAITSWGEDNIIRYNKFYNIGYNGITYYGLRTLIEYNYIEDVCLSLTDGGCIYTYNSSSQPNGSSGSIVRYNIVNQVASSTEVVPIYLDLATQDNTVDHNAIIGGKRNIQIGSTSNNTITYNNCYLPDINGIMQWKSDTELSGNTIENNYLFTEKLDVSGGLYRFLSEQDVCEYGTSDYNKLIAVNMATSGYQVVGHVNCGATDQYCSLDELTAITGQDANSSHVLIGTTWDNQVNDKSTVIYNDSKVTADIAIPTGTWYDLDGNNYTGTVSLPQFGSIILTNKIVVEAGDGLGPELVIDGTFENNGDSWGVYGESTISNNEGNVLSTDTVGSGITQSTILSGIDVYYSFEIISITGVMGLSIGGSGLNFTTTGIKTGTLSTATTLLEFKRAASNTCDAIIDNISVKEVL